MTKVLDLGLYWKRYISCGGDGEGEGEAQAELLDTSRPDRGRRPGGGDSGGACGPKVGNPEDIHPVSIFLRTEKIQFSIPDPGQAQASLRNILGWGLSACVFAHYRVLLR